MIQRLLLGILAGTLVGIFMTSFFLPTSASLYELFYSKITATSIITGFASGVYAHLSKSKLQIFMVSIVLGVIIFYAKYLITQHHFDPINMGAFSGALLGGVFAIHRQILHSMKVYRRLKKLKRRNLSNYD